MQASETRLPFQKEQQEKWPMCGRECVPAVLANDDTGGNNFKYAVAQVNTVLMMQYHRILSPNYFYTIARM